MSAYCQPADISRFGVAAEVIDDLSEADVLIPAIQSASSLMDSYLGGSGRYTLPIISAGPDLARAAAVLAAWDLVRVHRLKPGEDPTTNPQKLEAGKILDWLKMVAEGTVTPTDVVDSSVGDETAGDLNAGFINSNEQRGYFSADRFVSLPFQGRRQ
jgi:phage gp36-like protein